MTPDIMPESPPPQTDNVDHLTAPEPNGYHIIEETRFSPFGFTSTSPWVNSVLFMMSLPLQALAFLLLPRVIHAAVSCINEVYETTGRRARSPFASLPSIKIAGGIALLAYYHVWLAKLIIGSWKGMKRVREG